MNDQEIFDKVLERLRDGKGRCIRDGDCMYYDGVTGNRCAIGYLLPLEAAKQLVNIRASVVYLINHKTKLIPSYINSDRILLLSKLQMIHDNSDNWEDNKFIAEDKLKELADSFELEYRP